MYPVTTDTKTAKENPRVFAARRGKVRNQHANVAVVFTTCAPCNGHRSDLVGIL